MAWTSDDIFSGIKAAGESGLTLSKMSAKLRKTDLAGLSDQLQNLVQGEKIRGPFKKGKSQHYYAHGFGPSVESTSQKISALAREAGIKLLSKPGLEKKITGFYAQFFADGLQHAVSEGELLKLNCGKSIYFLHRDVAADYFQYNVQEAAGQTHRADDFLTMAEVLPVYERLKSEQSGHSTVTIFDLQKALNVSRPALHDFLLKESKAGRVSLHPTSSASYPQEVMDAGIKSEGYASPVVNVVFKENV